MEIAVIIVVLVIGYLWWAMSRFSKKRLGKKMRRLVNAAKFTTFAIFATHHSDAPADNESEPSGADMVAAASVNFLFGETPITSHESLNLREAHANAIKWMKNDDLLRELIVQSLRVAAQLGFMENGSVVAKGEDILMEFGPEYPIAPTTDTYEHLVQRAIGTLSPGSQASIRSRLGLASHE